MQTTQFQVQKDDIRQDKLAEIELCSGLAPGTIRLGVESFALTSNNVTYAATGNIIGYWNFFPAPEPWGVVPVWGFAQILASKCDGFEVGERIYGFLPFASQFDMQPGQVKSGSFVDIAPHRTKLPAIYNDYQRLGMDQASDPNVDAIRMLFQPLFATSFLLHDFLMEQTCFDAQNIILGSASSKTALGLARLFAKYSSPERKIIGLTSTGNVDFVKTTGDYDQVLSYDQIKELPQDIPSIYVDMSGNAAVKRSLHQHLADQMQYSCAVGISHWEQFEEPGEMPGAKPQFFFAPDQALKRRKQWGGAELQKRISTELTEWANSGMSWLHVEPAHGMEQAVEIFTELRSGNINPAIGHVVWLEGN
jgi:hypothetical protein